MKSGGHIDQDWVSKLITRNRALKSSLTAIIKREAPDRSIDLGDAHRGVLRGDEHAWCGCSVLDRWRLAPPVRRHRDVAHARSRRRRWRPPRPATRPGGPTSTPSPREHAVTALYNAGYLGANVCAQNDDRDGSNRCKKILEAANDLEVSRVLLDKALKALGENPSTDQIRSALGMENVAVSSRPAPWWDARHDLCLLKGVLEHGPLASEKVREAILEDQALDWPSDMPQAPPSRRPGSPSYGGAGART